MAVYRDISLGAPNDKAPRNTKSTKRKRKSRSAAIDRQAVETELLRVLERLDNALNGRSPVTTGRTHTVISTPWPEMLWASSGTNTSTLLAAPMMTSREAIQGWANRARVLALSLYRDDPGEIHSIIEHIISEANNQAELTMSHVAQKVTQAEDKIRMDRLCFEEYATTEMARREEAFEERVEKTVRQRIDKMFGRAATLHRKRPLRIAPGCTAETL